MIICYYFDDKDEKEVMHFILKLMIMVTTVTNKDGVDDGMEMMLMLQVILILVDEKKEGEMKIREGDVDDIEGEGVQEE